MRRSPSRLGPHTDPRHVIITICINGIVIFIVVVIVIVIVIDPEGNASLVRAFPPQILELKRLYCNRAFFSPTMGRRSGFSPKVSSKRSTFER